MENTGLSSNSGTCNVALSPPRVKMTHKNKHKADICSSKDNNEEIRRNKKPTSAIYNLVKSQDWSAALSRCASHPEDMHFIPAATGMSVLHCALQKAPPLTVNHCSDRENDSRTGVVFLEFLVYLMKSNPYFVSLADLDGYTPLHIACSKNSSVDVVKLLLARCPTNAETLERILELPLEIANKILTFVPNPALMKDSHGKTPLFLSCQWSKKRRNDPQPDVVKVLLEYAPHAKRIADKTSRTPLDVVLKQKKSRDLLMELLETESGKVCQK